MRLQLRPGRGFWLALAMGLPTASALAQVASSSGVPAAAGSPAFLLTPAVSLSETVTSNIGGAGIAGPSDAITRATAGLRLVNRTGQSRATLDYALSGLVFARNSDRNTHQQSLQSLLDLEWFEQRGALQAAATISQGAVSAFGAQPTASALPTTNVVEVRTARLSPRWDGPLGESLRLNVQGQVLATDAAGSSTGDSTSYLGALQVSPYRRGPLAWSLQLALQGSRFSAGRSSDTTRVVGGLSRELDEWDLRLTANAGYERGSVVSGNARSAANWGLGVSWVPSPRTLAELSYDRRLFGNAYAVALEHRTPHTVWRALTSRKLNESGTDGVAASIGTAYDLYFAQLASVEPDPVRRADLVLAFLSKNGIDPSTLGTASFLRSATTIDNLQQLSAAWRGPRSTATVTYSRNRSQRANSLLLADDDLSNSLVVVTTSWSVLLTHRLTPELTASTSVTVQSGDGDTAAQSSLQRTFTAQMGGALGAKSNWSLALRRALYETSLVPSSETTATASYTVRF